MYALRDAGIDYGNPTCEVFVTTPLNFFSLGPQSLRSYPKVVVIIHNHTKMNIRKLEIFNSYLRITLVYEENDYTNIMSNKNKEVNDYSLSRFNEWMFMLLR